GFLTGLSGAMLPGPLFVFVVSDAMRRGALSGVLAMLGHAAVEVPTILLLVLGLRVVGVSPVLYVVGGGALSLFAFKMGYDALHPERRPQKPACGRHGGAVLGGVAFTAFNPGFFVWWATVGCALLAFGAERLGAAGMTLVVLGHYFSDFGWYSLVAFSASRGFVVRHAPKLQLALSAFLLALGAYFLCHGVRLACGSP
ncbi:MAG: LysE family transporter, partial [Candidatus Alkanophagales archaeon]